MIESFGLRDLPSCRRLSPVEEAILFREQHETLDKELERLKEEEIAEQKSIGKAALSFMRSRNI